MSFDIRFVGAPGDVGEKRKFDENEQVIEIKEIACDNGVHITHLVNCDAAVVKGYLRFEEDVVRKIRNLSSAKYYFNENKDDTSIMKRLVESIFNQLHLEKSFEWRHKSIELSTTQVDENLYGFYNGMHRDGYHRGENREYNIVVHLGPNAQKSTSFSVGKGDDQNTNTSLWFTDDTMRCGDFSIHNFNDTWHSTPIRNKRRDRLVAILGIIFDEDVSMNELVAQLSENALHVTKRENEKDEEDEEVEEYESDDDRSQS